MGERTKIRRELGNETREEKQVEGKTQRSWIILAVLQASTSRGDVHGVDGCVSTKDMSYYGKSGREGKMNG